jgi:hypothetical protein
VRSLHELQRRFAAALFDNDCASISADIRPCGIGADARLEIYRAQLHATFLRTLTLEFPVTERIVGGDCFKTLARDFQLKHPSRAGDLHHIGAPFGAFLAERFGGGRYDYLSHVAALEWALQESMMAPAAAALDLEALRAIAPADYGQLHFALHPACRLFSSAYPVLDIWHANQVGAAASPSINLTNGATHALLHRPVQVVQFHRVSVAQAALLEALGRDLTLGKALDAALNADPTFDLGAPLRHFVALGVLTQATLKPQRRMPSQAHAQRAMRLAATAMIGSEARAHAFTARG